MNPKGVTVRESPYGVNETIDRIQEFVQQHGATVYARINQQTEANNAGQHLLPLQFIMFGNPKVGGPVMAENPIAALDLPLKIIAWEDSQHKVWLAYNDSSYIRERFSLSPMISASMDIDPIIFKVLKT